MSSILVQMCHAPAFAAVLASCFVMLLSAIARPNGGLWVPVHMLKHSVMEIVEFVCAKCPWIPRHSNGI